MDSYQAYAFLFNDSFLTSLLFVPRLPYAYDVMVALGDYNPYIVLIISLLASVLGFTVNWIMGLFIRRLEKHSAFAHRAAPLNKAEDFFARKGKWILLLAMIPFWGALFTTAAGVLRYRLFHFLILVTFSKFIGLAINIFF